MSVDLVTPQHFITHLHQVTSIEELALTERFVLHGVGLRMECPLLAERLGLWVDDAARFAGAHDLPGRGVRRRSGRSLHRVVLHPRHRRRLVAAEEEVRPGANTRKSAGQNHAALHDRLQRSSCRLVATQASAGQRYRALRCPQLDDRTGVGAGAKTWMRLLYVSAT